MKMDKFTSVYDKIINEQTKIGTSKVSIKKVLTAAGFEYSHQSDESNYLQAYRKVINDYVWFLLVVTPINVEAGYICFRGPDSDKDDHFSYKAIFKCDSFSDNSAEGSINEAIEKLNAAYEQIKQAIK